MDERYFSYKLAEWYESNHRKLPWRDTKDPYKIWLSEIILQQTRVNQGLPYYERFVEHFPDVSALAKAKEEDVLRLWQGLGYYTRARNLHKCAKEIAQKHKGKFPGKFSELKKLPGIGDYTAAAIASIAFNEPVAVVDGNVFRVLARVFGIESDISTVEGKKAFTIKANKLLDHKRPDIHNQAVMEFGALYCTPQKPGCNDCIFSNQCEANRVSIQDELPVKSKMKKSKNRYFFYFVFRNGNSLAMKKRMDKDIWNGLFDFHLIEKTRPTAIDKILKEDTLLRKLDIADFTLTVGKSYKHVLSHQIIHAKFIQVTSIGKAPAIKQDGLRFYTRKAVDDLPKPILINRFLTDSKIL